MKASFWLIDNHKQEFPTVALEVARMRGLRVERLPFSNDTAPADVAADRCLIAITFDQLRHLTPTAQARLKTLVANGATLHVKGDTGPGRPCTLAPFAKGQFLVSRITIASGYRMTDDPMLPGPLQNEERSGSFTTPIALGLPASARPLMLARGVDGVERPAIFVMESGDGVVIYDLQPDLSAKTIPTPAILEDPDSLPKAVGTLAAAKGAWEATPEQSQLNLVIDDRPANFDYFNCSRMLAFLRHLDHRFPGVHVDFAWTPERTHPSSRYVAAMKSFHTGFVWHGLLHHVDHRPITDLSAEFAAGQRLVEQVSAAHGVRFQPVMVFPFEKDTPQCVEFLQRQGFIAKAQTPPDSAAANGGDRGAMTAGMKSASGTPHERFAILERFPVERLTRNRMLARAVLGLPIIAAAHPPEIGLARLAALRPGKRGSFAHFDPVLRFAAEKHLRTGSLEEIAHQAIACG